MPRKPRVEYAGAVYHVISRGNRLQKIFWGDADCEMFLETLGESCQRTGWRVHAYALMGNHYHLLLETPEPNLVAGMHWVQSTYTQRFNVRHREWGHLFQGRYKAIPVEAGDGYFSTLATYIHLNPVRIRGYDFDKQRLVDFGWSSFPAYVGKAARPGWLTCHRVLGDLGMADTPAGRRKYAQYISGRVEEVRHSAKPWKADEAWQNIRRGWHWGGKEFRQKLLERIGGAVKKADRRSFSGGEIQAHDEACAEQWIAKGLTALGITEPNLADLHMTGPEKVALAWLVRQNTSMRTTWIKARLGMGTATCFAAYLKNLEKAKKGDWGYDAWRAIRSIQQHKRRNGRPSFINL